MNADTTYAVVAGLIQFEPDTREVHGETVRDVKVRAIGSQKIVRVTVWSSHAGVELAKGDYIAAEGKWRETFKTDANGNVREYLDLDASTLVRVPALKRVGDRPTDGQPRASRVGSF